MSPDLSIITVCKNARASLLKTADSVFAINPEALEWIIVDGESTDGTRSILEQWDMPWIRWISEPDAGIYDAMNKGLQMARGEWVWFLNAGDRIYSKAFPDIFHDIDGTHDIVFGEVLVEGKKGEILGKRSEATPHKLPEKLSRDKFTHGMPVSHQAFIVRREIAPPYSAIRYNYSADLDWMLRILENPRKSLKMDVVSIVEREGATIQNWRQSQWERFRIMGHHFGFLPTILHHAFIVLRRLGFLFKGGSAR